MGSRGFQQGSEVQVVRRHCRKGGRSKGGGGRGTKKAQPGRLGFIWNPGAGDDVCQFWPEAGTGTGGTVAEDRQVESDGDREAGTRTGGRKDRSRRLRSPMQGQKRRGWQRLTP